MKTFDSIKKGLEEAIEHTNGHDIGAVERTLTKTNTVQSETFGLSAQDVAVWLIRSNNANEESDYLTNLKLQKLLYYAQGLAIKYTGKTLFTDEIYALKYGPVVLNVYEKYKQFERNPIEENADTPDFTGDVRTILEDTIEEYGQFSAWKLVNMTHSESPWQTTALNHVIPTDKMQAFFAR